MPALERGAPLHGGMTSLLRKIDCVMIRVSDLDAGARFYEQACGLRRLWSDASSVGLAMSDTDAEIVVHTMDLPRDCGVHFLVDDVPTAVAELVRNGSPVIQEPFEIPVGRCAVLADPFGNALCILDLSNRTRPGNTTQLSDTQLTQLKDTQLKDTQLKDTQLKD